jgi:hypothetical protein
MAGDDLADRVLVGNVRGDVLHVVAPRAQSLGRLLQRLGLARGHRQGIALVPQRLREDEPDPSGGSGDDGGTVGHGGGNLTARTVVGGAARTVTPSSEFR